jgi:Sugar (and other) transporter
LFIAELAPPDVRGMLVSLADISINLGILLGYASSLACDSVFHSDSAKWRAMVGLGKQGTTMQHSTASVSCSDHFVLAYDNTWLVPRMLVWHSSDSMYLR